MITITGHPTAAEIAAVTAILDQLPYEEPAGRTGWSQYWHDHTARQRGRTSTTVLPLRRTDGVSAGMASSRVAT